MTTSTLTQVGKVGGALIGTALGGPVGGIIGGAIGDAVGTQVGSNINKKNKQGARLTDLAVQSSAYSEVIPNVYGYGRLAGNIIWAQPIEEVATTSQSNSGGKGGGGQSASSTTTYSYYITMAVAICAGPIDELLRVWADAKLINPADYTMRLYNGDETQAPDSLIESIEGVGTTPAYRGLCYIVIENFPLADYGNRIPNFTFEVHKNANVSGSSEVPLEQLIESMILIPGAGEFVYDDTVESKVPGELVGSDWVQRGNITRINQNNNAGKADGLVALDQLAITCPNVQWVAPVVCWFGDSINAGSCIIQPGVEFKTGATTSPDVWEAGGYDRSSARQITLVDGSPQYGGTPSDASLLRYLTELKNRGYSIMFYPMLFMDVTDKPWRGRITGSSSDVVNFFTKTNGYNEFITYYANLVKDYVDAFVIGSELVGLTSVQALDNSFPAVTQLVALAATVKGIVGAGVKVTYAADWSEYHDFNGWYNLDPLWSSSNIDVVGIDAYFPLTDAQEPQAGFLEADLMAGWTSGELYDWYYTDMARTIQASLTPQYAKKNIAWWWNNHHVNPDSSTTGWTPNSKKIWFTEYGYPSVDGCSNQPNVFYDPGSSESAFPYHSRGRVDFRAQRNALAATEKQWASSSMIERKFVWTWDARPFPFWPDLTNIWADGNLWRTGHWVQGKLGSASLAAIVEDLSIKAGLEEEQVDVSRLTDLVDGYIIKSQTTVRDAIDSLRNAYFFDAVESGGLVKYVKRGVLSDISIDQDSLIANKDTAVIAIARQQELELPQKVDVVYINQAADYQSGNQHSQRLTVSSTGTQTISLSIVMDGQTAKNIADLTLFNAWKERNSYDFTVPIEYAYIEPTDVVTVAVEDKIYTVRVLDTRLISPGIIKIQGVEEDVSVYDFYNEPGAIVTQTFVANNAGDTVLALLDLPSLPSDADTQGYIRYAVCGLEQAWRGAAVYTSNDNGANYSQLVSIVAPAVIGVAVNALGAASSDIFDCGNNVTVSLYGNGELSSLTELAILNGSNMARLGDEIIQFTTATLVTEGKYNLSGFLRGRLGTENAIGSHVAAEEFVLIDSNLVKEAEPNALIGIGKLYKGVSFGNNVTDAASETFTYEANTLRPFSPVHIAGSRDGSGNLTVTWVRRTRIDGQWRDNVDVALGEASEEYEVDILNGSSVVRTISSITSPSCSYSAAQQVTDFGVLQASVSLHVYQISEAVGRGGAGAGVV